MSDGSNMSNGSLTLAELQRLSYYKWRYAFEAIGFTATEICQLMFVTWLHCTGRY